MAVESVTVRTVFDDPRLVGAVGRALLRVRRGTGLRLVLDPAGHGRQLDRAARTVGPESRTLVMVTPGTPGVGSREPRAAFDVGPGKLGLRRSQTATVVVHEWRDEEAQRPPDLDGGTRVSVPIAEDLELVAAAALWPMLSNDGLHWFRRDIPATVGLTIPYALSVLLHRKACGGRREGRLSEADLARVLGLTREGLGRELERRRIGHPEQLGPLLDTLAVTIRVNEQGERLENAVQAVGFDRVEDMKAVVERMLRCTKEEGARPEVEKVEVWGGLEGDAVAALTARLVQALKPSNTPERERSSPRGFEPRAYEEDMWSTQPIQRFGERSVRGRYREWFDLAYSHATRKGWSREDAEDLASGVILNILKRKRPNANIELGYVRRVAENLMRNWEKSRSRIKAGGCGFGRVAGSVSEVPPDPALMLRIEYYEKREGGPRPERARVEEWNPEVVDALAALTPRQRTVLVLSDAFEMKRNGVAALMGMTRTAVDVAVHRARALLKVRLARSGGDGGEPLTVDRMTRM